MTMIYDAIAESDFRKKLFDFLANVENIFLKPYLDTVGHPTIGIGFDLTVESVRKSVFNAMGIDPAGDMARALSKAIASVTGSKSDVSLTSALNKAYGQPFVMTREQIRTVYDAIVDKYLDKAQSLTGLDYSAELLAMTSAAFNGVIGTETAKALDLSDPYEARAEAWYQIRYVHADQLWSRRYQEAAVFGLYEKSEGITQPVSIEEALGIYKMYTKEAMLPLKSASGGMAAYDYSHKRYLNLANAQIAGFDSSLGVGSLSSTLKPAATALLQNAFDALPSALAINLNPLNLKVTGDHQLTYVDKDPSGAIKQTIQIKFDDDAEHITVLDNKGRTSSYDVTASGSSTVRLSDNDASTEIAYSDQKTFEHATRYSPDGQAIANIWDENGSRGVSLFGSDGGTVASRSSLQMMSSVDSSQPTATGTVKMNADGEITADVSYGNDYFHGSSSANSVNYSARTSYTSLYSDGTVGPLQERKVVGTYSSGNGTVTSAETVGGELSSESTVTANARGTHGTKTTYFSPTFDRDALSSPTAMHAVEDWTVNNDGSIEFDYKFNFKGEIANDKDGNPLYKELHVKISSSWQVETLTSTDSHVPRVYSSEGTYGSSISIDAAFVPDFRVYRDLSGTVTAILDDMPYALVSADGKSFYGGGSGGSAKIGSFGDQTNRSNNKISMAGTIGNTSFSAGNAGMGIGNNYIYNKDGLLNGVDDFTLTNGMASISINGMSDGDSKSTTWTTSDGYTTTSFQSDLGDIYETTQDQSSGVSTQTLYKDMQLLSGQTSLNGTAIFTTNAADGGSINTYLDDQGSVLRTDILYEDGSHAITAALEGGGTSVTTYNANNVKDYATETLASGAIRNINYSSSGEIAQLQFLGTDLDEVSIGSAGDDVLSGVGGSDSLFGGKGDDILQGGTGFDTYIFSKGDGNDVIEDSDEDVYDHDALSFKEGISVSDLKLSKRAQDVIVSYNGGADSVTLAGWLDSERATAVNFNDLSSANIISGTDESNYLVGTDGDDIFLGGGGDDYFVGGMGEDTYLISKDQSLVGIANDSQTEDDILKFDDSILPNEVTVSRREEDLIFYVGEATVVELPGWFSEWGSRLTHVEFADGTHWSESELLAATSHASERDDYLTGSSEPEVIDGLDGNDWIDGGEGNDTIIGGGGDDTMIGGAGSDTFVLSNSSGNDVILSDGTSDTDYIEFANDVAAASVIVTRSQGDLYLSWNDGQSKLTLSDWFWDDLARRKSIRFADGTEWNSALIEQHIANIGTIGADYLTGTEQDDSIDGLDGDDQIAGNGGADLLDGGNGDDVLFGGHGPDTILGGTGNDELLGGDGADTYVFSRGDGHDVIYEDEIDAIQANVIQFDSTVTRSEIDIKQSNSDLVIRYGESDSVTLRGWFGGIEGNIVDRLNFADGTSLLAAELTRQAMTGTPGDDYINGTWSNDEINGGAGNDTLYANPGDDVLHGGDGNDSLSGQSGIDLLFGDAGNDSLVDQHDGGLLSGGDGDDWLVAYAPNYLVGGSGDDNIWIGADNSVVGFNGGDGIDSLYVHATSVTVSLGGDIDYDALQFEHVNNDLVLWTADDDGLIFKDWYASDRSSTHIDLQMIIEGSSSYDPASNSSIHNMKIQNFDLSAMIEDFNETESVNGSVGKWSIEPEFVKHLISSSDEAAIGGFASYEFGTGKDLSNISVEQLRINLGAADYGTVSQPIKDNRLLAF